MLKIIEEELQSAALLLDQFLKNEANLSAISLAAELMVASLKEGGKIMSCGNGGSACDAIHFAEELSGKFREDRKAFAAMALSDVGHITCTANDYGFQYVYSRYLEALGQKGDVLLAISTSGQSENILRAAETAKKKGIKVIALTGKNGGKLRELADVEINVGHFGYADRIQEIHIKIIHILILLIEKAHVS